MQMHSIQEIESLKNIFYVYDRNNESICDWPESYTPTNMFCIKAGFKNISSSDIRSGRARDI